MDHDVKALEKRARTLKRIASEWASKLHDLVEDRLPANYQELPAIAESTYNACREWAETTALLERSESSSEPEQKE